ncbi:MAG: hypothetical protein EHJ95_04610 [Methanobacteriota archaeon]|nr:MAG: hypothetical protein EHJ95_04610 [Euryarchaeota archaeon]
MNEETYFLENPVKPQQGGQEEYFLEKPATTAQPYDANKYGMGSVYAAHNAPETDIGPLRHVVRTGARIAEGAVGAVGGLAKLGLGAVDYATKKLGSHQGILKDTTETTGTHLADMIPDALSSSEGFREAVTKPLFGKAQEAQGETEKFFDDMADLTGSLAVPIPGLGGLKLARAAGLAAAGATTGYLAKNFAPEGFEAPAKAGGVIAASLLLHRFPKNQFPSGVMKDAYKGAEKALQEPGIISSLRTDSTQGREFINEMDSLAKRGRLGSSKGVYKEFRQNAFDTGRMDIAEVQKLKVELNDIYRAKKGVNEEWIKDLDKGITKSKAVLKEYGDTYNPTYIQELSKADEMYGALAGAKKLSEFLPKNMRFLKGASSELLGVILGAPTGLIGAAKGAALGAGVHGAEATINAARAAFKSPHVRKAYGDLLTSVLKDNKASAIKALNSLNSALKENE